MPNRIDIWAVDPNVDDALARIIYETMTARGVKVKILRDVWLKSGFWPTWPEACHVGGILPEAKSLLARHAQHAANEWRAWVEQNANVFEGEQ